MGKSSFWLRLALACGTLIPGLPAAFADPAFPPFADDREACDWFVSAGRQALDERGRAVEPEFLERSALRAKLSGAPEVVVERERAMRAEVAGPAVDLWRSVWADLLALPEVARFEVNLGLEDPHFFIYSPERYCGADEACLRRWSVNAMSRPVLGEIGISSTVAEDLLDPAAIAMVIGHELGHGVGGQPGTPEGEIVATSVGLFLAARLGLPPLDWEAFSASVLGQSAAPKAAKLYYRGRSRAWLVENCSGDFVFEESLRRSLEGGAGPATADRRDAGELSVAPESTGGAWASSAR